MKKMNAEGLEDERKTVLNKYVAYIKKQDYLSNSLSDIMLSLTHMFCNRLNGDRAWEREMMSLTYLLIYNYNNYIRKTDA